MMAPSGTHMCGATYTQSEMRAGLSSGSSLSDVASTTEVDRRSTEYDPTQDDLAGHSEVRGSPVLEATGKIYALSSTHWAAASARSSASWQIFCAVRSISDCCAVLAPTRLRSSSRRAAAVR